MQQRICILICLQILALATSVHADPSPPETPLQGTLQLPEGISLEVVSAEGNAFSVVSQNGQATLPFGEYSVRRWTFQKKDAEGKVWKIQADSASSIQFKITELAAALQIAPERIQTTLTVGGSDDYVFWPTLQGLAGETLYLYCDDERIPPKVEITNQAKNFVVTLTGTYG